AIAAGFVERSEGLATIRRLRPGKSTHVQGVRIQRIDAQLAEVHRTRIAIAHDAPRTSAIVRAEDATLGCIERGDGSAAGAGSAVVARGDVRVVSGIVAATAATTAKVRQAGDELTRRLRR